MNNMTPQPQRKPDGSPDLEGVLKRLYDHLDQANPGSLRELQEAARANVQNFRLAYRERRYWTDVLHLIRNQVR